MNEETSALKFLLWAGGIALLCSGTISLAKATSHMAGRAIDAERHERISYGQYSRMLWNSHKPPVQKKSH